MVNQRRIVIGMCIAASAAFLQPATYNYMITPMLVTFGAGQAAAAPLRETPSIASLLVIFLAAVLARRLGQRPIIGIGALTLIAGSLLLALAPTLVAAVAGVAVQAVGATILLIVPLGVIAAAVRQSAARARAFAYFSMVSPLVFVILPVLAAALMQHMSWRVVALLWALGGVAALVANQWAQAPGAARTHEELLSPSFAGLLCVGLVQIVSHLSAGPQLSAATAVRVGIVVVAALGLALTVRRPGSSLNPALLRRPGFVLMLSVVGLWCFTALWYYMTLAYEYVFGQSVMTTAVLMVPAQACAVVGARMAGHLVARAGITAPGVWLLLLTALSLALSASIQATSPLWWAVVVTGLYSFASVAAGVPMTKALMDTALDSEEPQASAYRQAAIGLGTAVGIAVVSALVLATFNASLTAGLQAGGLDTQQGRQIASDMRTGITEQQEAAQYAVPLTEVDAVNQAQQEAFLDGLATQGWAGAGLSIATAGLLGISRRRVSLARRG